MEAGHLKECNKQLFEDQLRRVILEAKERVQKAKAQPGAESTGERPVLDTQISSESITIGAVSQQVICPFILLVYEACLINCTSFCEVAGFKQIPNQ